MADATAPEMLRDAITDVRVSDQLWIYFIAGAIRSTSRARRPRPAAGANSELAILARLSIRAARWGRNELVRRDVIRIARNPFDFGSTRNEYQMGSGGEWRILHDGVVRKTDPQRIDEPVLYPELTPFDVLDVAAGMTITERIYGENMYGPCTRLIGVAFDGVEIPELWDADSPLTVEVQIDDRGQLRVIEIEASHTDRRYRLGTRLTCEYRPHPSCTENGQPG